MQIKAATRLYIGSILVEVSLFAALVDGFIVTDYVARLKLAH